MIMALENSGINITADSIKVKLLQEVQSDKSDIVKEEAAFYSKYKTKWNNGITEKKQNNGGRKEQEIPKCYGCGKTGHVIARCRNKTNERDSRTVQHKHRAFTSVTSNDETSNESNNTEWLLDSGSSSHMTGNRNFLRDIKPCEKKIKIANCDELRATAAGTAELEVIVAGQRQKIDIIDTLYVPGLATNLLSVERIASKDYRVQITKHGCEIFDPEGDRVATARATAGVYVMNLAHEQSYLAAEDDKRGNIWHRRLGHIGKNNTVILANNFKDLKIKVNEKFCNICVQGKSAQKPFYSSNKRAKNLLDIIHSDINGPMSCESIDGARYFVVFIDDYSRKKFVYCIKHKSEVCDIFKGFKAHVEKQTGRKIKVIRTDNGREYVNREFCNFLREEGIVHQRTVPYSPQQNGLAERANRTIVERARCLLTDSGLSKDFWAEATVTATYLLNRNPASALNGKTPEEYWSKVKPKLEHLRIFGCKAWAHIPKQKRDKWDMKAKELVFVGYDEQVKGYRLIDMQTKKISISRDVTFDENTVGNNKDKTYNIKTIFEYGSIPNFQEEEEQEERIENVKDNREQPKEDQIKENELPEREKKGLEFLLYLTKESISEETPETYTEAMRAPDKQEWERAMQREIEALRRNNTWTKVRKPIGEKTLTMKWVFQKKNTVTGESRYKARLVARGCGQIKGHNYEEIFSPVVKHDSLGYLWPQQQRRAGRSPRWT